MRKTILALAAGLCLNSFAYELKTNLPAVYIETENGAEITSTEVYTSSTLTIVDTDGQETAYPLTKVRGRGNTLFTLAKKPYKLKLNKKAALLTPDGAKGKKWNLMADHGDKTLLRNAVASFIATEAGQPFAPGARYVDFILNGVYQGTYRLTDQIDIRKQRVNITEQPEIVTDLTDITGGYLLEIDDSADDLEGSVITTPNGVKVTIKSPDEDVIVATQTEYISNHLAKFENALFSTNWLDPEKGYRQYIDMPSLIQWYITAELTAEPNSFRSVYFYKEKADNKFYFGPVWDFDFAFDNASKWGSRPRALVAQEGRGPEWCFSWINRLRQDPNFHKEVNEAWKKLLADGIVTKTINYIDETAATIDRSQKLNFGLYPINEKAHDEQHLFSSYAEGVSFLKENLKARAEFLSQAFETLASGGSVPIVGNPDESALEDIETTPDYYVSVSNHTLKFSSLNAINGSWTIYNLSGQSVSYGQIAPRIDLSGLSDGTYILQWTVGNKTKSAKFAL